MLPEALIDGRGWKGLAARAALLPPSAADAMFGFECSLDHPEASADLLVTVLPNSRFADALVRDGASGSLAAALARFLSELRQSDSPFAAAIDRMALEYDIAGIAGVPAPGFFLYSADGHSDPGLLAEAIALAAGWDEEPAERRGTARILAALPSGAAIRWAGSFPDREKRAVRFLVRGLGGGSAAFLSRIGWPGDTTAVDGIVAEYRARGLDNHVLALDIADGRVSPGLGLELSRPGRIGGWKPALDNIARRHGGLPEKTAAFGRAARSERIYARAGLSEFHCGLHHVKLSLSACDGRVTGVKGYIACGLVALS